jgi:hypothetical protein
MSDTLNIAELKEHLDHLKAWQISDCTLNATGSDLLWHDPDYAPDDQSGTYVLASSDYNTDETTPRPAFLATALAVLQASPLITAEIERLRHALTEAQAR